MRVKLTAGIRYQGEHRDAGEVLDVAETLARLLVQANRAVILPAEPPPAAVHQVPKASALHVVPEPSATGSRRRGR